MFKILENKQIGRNTHCIKILAPRVSRTAKAGQFVILRVDREGERVPFTIADAIPEEHAIVLIIQSVGATSDRLRMLEVDDELPDVLGPLGNPSHIQYYGNVLLVGGGYGAATFNLLAKALREAGNTVEVIVGAKTADLVIIQENLNIYTQKIHIATDDGSLGAQGSVVPLLEGALADGAPWHIDCVFAVGPLPMMKVVSDITLPKQIKTYVSLNPIMMDGAGLCGGCRVRVDNQMKFACVDGPEFDAHTVDFEDLMRRNQMYKAFENRENCRLVKVDEDPQEKA